MRIRISNSFLLAALLWPFCLSLNLADDPILFKGISSAAISFSRDGKWLAAAGSVPTKTGDSVHIPTSGLVKVWEVSTGKEVFQHVEAHWEATCLSFSPTAPLLAVGFDDRPRGKVTIENNTVKIEYDENMPPVPVKVWNLETSKEHRCFLHDEDGSSLDNINGVSFSPDGKTLATANNKLHFWDVETRGRRFIISDLRWYSVSAVLSPDGKVVAARTSSSSSTPGPRDAIELWDIETKVRANTFVVADHGRVLTFSRDGRYLAFSGADENTVHIYDMHEKKVVSNFQVYTTHFHCVAFSPDGKTIYTGGNDGKPPQMESSWKAWDAKTGRLLNTEKCPLTSANVLAVSPDGQQLAIGGADGTVMLWKLPK